VNPLPYPVRELSSVSSIFIASWDCCSSGLEVAAWKVPWADEGAILVYRAAGSVTTHTIR
jgi:hypothetical protein